MGIFIGGYNRNVTIERNEFEFIGGSAMAAWGDTSTAISAAKNTTVQWPIGPDGRGGAQPRGVRVLSNIVQVCAPRREPGSARAKTGLSADVARAHR